MRPLTRGRSAVQDGSRRLMLAMAFASTMFVGSCASDPAPDTSRLEAGTLAESLATRARVDELRARFAHAVPPSEAPRGALGASVASGFELRDGQVHPLIPAAAKRGVTRTASVTLPLLATGSVRLEDDTSHVEVSFALRGASSVMVATAAGLAVYSRTFDGADVLHRVHTEGTEDYVVFEERPAKEELTYDVEVSRVAGLRLVSNTLEFLDEGGSPRLRVAPPYVVDALGTRSAAALALEGCAYDADARGPWGRAVTPAGSSHCTLRVAWKAATYPALVDPSWMSTGSMALARADHTATLLGSGRVLIAGGHGAPMTNAGDAAFSSAELYDPNGTFAATGSMGMTRGGHTATLLGSGMVLVAGGDDGTAGAARSSAELYDPNGSGTFMPTGAMGAARVAHTATLLGSGTVLIAGGYADTKRTAVSSAELYDPTGSGTFTPTGAMGTARGAHTATLLGSGKVLVAGGQTTSKDYGVSSAELYDPSGSGTFVPAASMSAARYEHTATLLPSGEVLLAGGSTSVVAERYDPTGSGTFAATGTMGDWRYGHTATLLGSGTVLVAGGIDGPVGLPAMSAESYDATGSGSFTDAVSMNARRLGHSATLLASGDVLVAGGYSETMACCGYALVLSSAELYGLTCAPLSCVQGKQTACGVIYDTCGGSLDCGACASPAICSQRRLCEVPPPVPDAGPWAPYVDNRSGCDGCSGCGGCVVNDCSNCKFGPRIGERPPVSVPDPVLFGVVVVALRRRLRRRR